MTRSFKLSFLSLSVLLYVTGLIYFVLDQFFTNRTEFGEQHTPHQLLVLQIHGMVGLLFLFFFGYLYATHVLPGLRGSQRKLSGYTVLAVVLILCLTVPGLYYLGSEGPKQIFESIHTYLGLVTIAPFLVHAWKRR